MCITHCRCVTAQHNACHDIPHAPILIFCSSIRTLESMCQHTQHTTGCTEHCVRHRQYAAQVLLLKDRHCWCHALCNAEAPSHLHGTGRRALTWQVCYASRQLVKGGNRNGESLTAYSQWQWRRSDNIPSNKLTSTGTVVYPSACAVQQPKVCK